MPRLRAWGAKQSLCELQPVLPAVTCSVQAGMLTGLPVREHGIVGNGWYDRELAEVQFWKQSNHLVAGDKVWDAARRRDPSFTCANLFWWFNMYSSVNVAVTPRPIYAADGRKIPDLYTTPSELRHELQEKLGRFPLFNFWGPLAGIKSTRWIVDAAIHTHAKHNPTLTLLYLPHLDYDLQRFGPHAPEALRAAGEVDAELGKLLDYLESRKVQPIVLSEYGIEPIDDAIHINRVLRDQKLLTVREEQGGEILDAGASAAFAVADHQIAHVYVKNGSDLQRVAEICRAMPGVEQVFDAAAQTQLQIDHARAGELVLVAAPRRWFSYYYWRDDARAPDFARTVDIHRKPGYDPCELLLDPSRSSPARLAWKKLRTTLGLRTLFDFIPLDAALVRGSHGRTNVGSEYRPILLAPEALLRGVAARPCTAMHDLLLSALFSAP